MRHRQAGSTARPPVPDWVREFVPADWARKADRPPKGWPFGRLMWRDIRARERWRRAGEDWLSAYGYDAGDWFRLTRPVVVSR